MKHMLVSVAVLFVVAVLLLAVLVEPGWLMALPVGGLLGLALMPGRTGTRAARPAVSRRRSPPPVLTLVKGIASEMLAGLASAARTLAASRRRTPAAPEPDLEDPPEPRWGERRDPVIVLRDQETDEAWPIDPPPLHAAEEPVDLPEANGPDRREELRAQRLVAADLLRRGIPVLVDVFIPLPSGGTIRIDLIGLTAQGLVVAEVKPHTGILVAQTEAYWRIQGPDGPDYLFNPLRQLSWHLNALRQAFGEAPCVGFVVFPLLADATRIELCDGVVDAIPEDFSCGCDDPAVWQVWGNLVAWDANCDKPALLKEQSLSRDGVDD